MLPTFQSFDDKKITKTFPKRPIKPPIQKLKPPTLKMKQMSAMTTASTTTAIVDAINESAPVTQNLKVFIFLDFLALIYSPLPSQFFCKIVKNGQSVKIDGGGGSK